MSDKLISVYGSLSASIERMQLDAVRTKQLATLMSNEITTLIKERDNLRTQLTLTEANVRALTVKEEDRRKLVDKCEKLRGALKAIAKSGRMWSNGVCEIFAIKALEELGDE